MPPTTTPASKLTKKCHRYESNVDGGANLPSDTDSNAPAEEPPHVVRTSTCQCTPKWAKGAATTDKAASKAATKYADSHTSLATEDVDKSDSMPDESATGCAHPSSITGSARHAAHLKERYGDLSMQESLDAHAAKWTSPIYKHFRAPVLFTRPNSSITIWFICDYSPSKHVDHAPNDESTGNLHRHIGKCEPTKTGETELISESSFKIPSHVTVLRNLKDIFEDLRKKAKEKLQNLPGKIHICLDGWTSPNIISFLGMTAHWHADGKIEHVILDFIKLTKGHTDAYLAQKLLELLQEFGIVNKVLVITCNNASNNAKMMKDLQVLEPDFCGSEA